MTEVIKVAGTNLFGQWMCDENICQNFKVNSNEVMNKSNQMCFCWSYNIYKMDNNLYISGAFGGKVNQFIKLDLIEELQEDIIATGNDYRLIIVNVKTNSVFTFDLHTLQFKRVKFVETVNEEFNKNKIEKVVANNNLCLYLTSKGHVYCGILPVLLDTNEVEGKVIDIALGYEHSILLTDIGRVYTWGNGRRLQLGHGDLCNLEQPTELNALAGIIIKKISAGGWHSCAISEFGDLYVWGWNDTGQLGIKEQLEENKSELQSYGLPLLVDLYDENDQQVDIHVKDVACGSRHTAILLEDGSVWTSGSNKYGQLGFCTKDIKKLESFKKAQTDVSLLLCGLWSTVIKT